MKNRIIKLVMVLMVSMLCACAKPAEIEIMDNSNYEFYVKLADGQRQKILAPKSEVYSIDDIQGCYELVTLSKDNFENYFELKEIDSTSYNKLTEYDLVDKEIRYQAKDGLMVKESKAMYLRYSTTAKSLYRVYTIDSSDKTLSNKTLAKEEEFDHAFSKRKERYYDNTGFFVDYSYDVEIDEGKNTMSESIVDMSTFNVEITEATGEMNVFDLSSLRWSEHDGHVKYITIHCPETDNTAIIVSDDSSGTTLYSASYIIDGEADTEKNEDWETNNYNLVMQATKTISKSNNEDDGQETDIAADAREMIELLENNVYSMRYLMDGGGDNIPTINYMAPIDTESEVYKDCIDWIHERYGSDMIYEVEYQSGYSDLSGHIKRPNIVYHTYDRYNAEREYVSYFIVLSNFNPSEKTFKWSLVRIVHKDSRSSDDVTIYYGTLDNNECMITESGNTGQLVIGGIW